MPPVGLALVIVVMRQVLEEGEGADKQENLRDRDGYVAQVEGSKGGRQSVELKKGGSIISRYDVAQSELYEVTEGINPGEPICSCSRNSLWAINCETARVVSGRMGRIRKVLLPLFDG